MTDIQNLLLNRARLGLATTLGKVRAHAGVPGNEAADAGATHAAKDPSACTHTHATHFLPGLTA